jgi:hypothetical protein
MKSWYDINWKGTVSFSTKGHPYYMNNEGRPLLFVCKPADVSKERDIDTDMCTCSTTVKEIRPNKPKNCS